MLSVRLTALCPFTGLLTHTALITLFPNRKPVSPNYTTDSCIDTTRKNSKLGLRRPERREVGLREGKL